MAASGFVPASERDVFIIGPPEQSGSKTDNTLSGEEARQFYEDLMREESSFGRQERRGRRARRRVRAVELQQRAQDEPPGQRQATGERQDNRSGETRSRELQGLRLLRCAQEGDLPGLKELLSKGVDINFQDTFLWTAVMCASWSGQRSAVRLLLRHGAAWVGVVDTQGRDAQELASEAGHTEVLEELLNNGRSPKRATKSDDRLVQAQWCDVCCNEYRSSHSSHLSSTLHQFSLQHPPPSPYYCLPPSSNSYRMMVRCGWKPGTGLGPEGEGSKQPVSTVLKRDYGGLGYGQMKRARITHFQARDCDAVKPPSREKREMGQKGQKREETMRKEQRDKNWERDFRASFYLS